MQSLEYFGVFTRQFWYMNVRKAPLTWSERIFCPASFRVLIHFASRIFCVIENHYVHTARNFSLSGLKLTNLGEFFIFYSRWNLESGSFTFMRNSVCKYRRNSPEFRAFLLQKIPRNSAEFRGIPYVFQKIPYSVGSKKRTSVDTLVMCRRSSLLTGEVGGGGWARSQIIRPRESLALYN
jgi:hypothetical protein